jgi:hypothetical protein
VPCTNPFLPPLIRLEAEEVFEGFDGGSLQETLKGIDEDRKIKSGSDADVEESDESEDVSQRFKEISLSSQFESFSCDEIQDKEVKMPPLVPIYPELSFEDDLVLKLESGDDIFQSLNGGFAGSITSGSDSNDDQAGKDPIEHDHQDDKNSKEFKIEFIDDLMLWTFLPVVRDTTIKLDNEKVPRDESFTLYISELFSPARFWFHYEHDVTEMMNQLQVDYGKLRPLDLRISDETLQPGLLIACFYDETRQWHRAQIIKPPNEAGYARVIFIDYGSVGSYSKTNFKFLFEKYVKYPRYANRGSLLNLKPPGKEFSWSESQVSKFLTRFGNKALKAKVLRYFGHDNSYELDIEHQSSQGNVINLRTWAIEKGIAQEFELLPINIQPFCYTIETFDDLEKTFPTFHERTLMNEKSIDFNLLLETNFLLNPQNEAKEMKPGVLKMLGTKEFKRVKKYHFD